MLMNQKDRPPGSWRTSVAGKRIAWVFLAILLVLLRVPGTSGQSALTTVVDVDVNVTVYTEPNYSGIAVKLYDEGLYISDDNGNTFLGSIKIRNGWQALIYQGRGRNGSPLAALYYDTPSLENIGLNIMTSWTLYPSKPTIYHDQPECPGPNFNSSTKPCDCKPGYYGSRCQYECPDCGPIVYPSDPAYPDFEAQKVTTEANGGYLLRSGACRGGVKGDGKCLCGPAYTPGPDGRCSVKRQNFRLNNAVATGANGVLHEQIGCVGGCGFNGICNTAIKRCQCHFGWTSPASGTPCSVCAPGFYKDKDGDCVRCWKGCIECYDTTGYCKTCLPGTKLVNDPANPLENQLVCIPKTKPDGTSFCSKGWFWNDVECKRCQPFNRQVEMHYRDLGAYFGSWTNELAAEHMKDYNQGPKPSETLSTFNLTCTECLSETHCLDIDRGFTNPEMYEQWGDSAAKSIWPRWNEPALPESAPVNNSMGPPGSAGARLPWARWVPAKWYLREVPYPDSAEGKAYLTVGGTTVDWRNRIQAYWTPSVVSYPEPTYVDAFYLWDRGSLECHNFYGQTVKQFKAWQSTDKITPSGVFNLPARGVLDYDAQKGNWFNWYSIQKGMCDACPKGCHRCRTKSTYITDPEIAANPSLRGNLAFLGRSNATHLGELYPQYGYQGLVNNVPNFLQPDQRAGPAYETIARGGWSGWGEPYLYRCQKGVYSFDKDFTFHQICNLTAQTMTQRFGPLELQIWDPATGYTPPSKGLWDDPNKYPRTSANPNPMMKHTDQKADLECIQCFPGNNLVNGKCVPQAVPPGFINLGLDNRPEADRIAQEVASKYHQQIVPEKQYPWTGFSSCHWTCATCAAPGDASTEGCNSCDPLNYLSAASCSARLFKGAPLCNAGSVLIKMPYFTPTNPQRCEACHPACAECDGLGNDMCTKCRSPYVLYNNQCLVACPGGYGRDANGICQTCPAGCTQCMDSTKCLTCVTGKILWRSQCVEVCLAGEYRNELGACVPFTISTITQDPVTVIPDPVTVIPIPVTVTPDPVTVIPDPVTVSPDTVTVTPEPVTVSPDTVTITPEPVTVSPDTVTITPEPVTVSPDTVTITPEPVTMSPDTVTVTPEPVTVSPDTVTVTPEPVTVTPEPVTVSPDTVTITPEPVTVTPDPVTVIPDTVTVTPEPVTISQPPVTITQTPLSAPTCDIGICQVVSTVLISVTPSPATLSEPSSTTSSEPSSTTSSEPSSTTSSEATPPPIAGGGDDLSETTPTSEPTTTTIVDEDDVNGLPQGTVRLSPGAWVKKHWYVPGIIAIVLVIGSVALLFCVRNYNKDKRFRQTDQHLDKWETAMAAHRVDALGKSGQIGALGDVLEGGMGSGLRGQRFSAMIKRPLSMFGKRFAGESQATTAGNSAANLVGSAGKDLEVSHSPPISAIKSQSARDMFNETKHSIDLENHDHLPNIEEAIEEDLIRFSVARPRSEADMIRFSTAPGTATTRLSRFRPVQERHPGNAEASSSTAPVTTEADFNILPARLQLNYNTDLKMGDPLPSDNLEKRIYAGTLAKDQGFMPRRVAIEHVWRRPGCQDDTSTATAFIRQVTLMAALSTQDSIARIVGYCTIPRVIVTDLYEGDLDYILGNKRFDMPEARVQSIILDVARGLAAIHSLNHVHLRIRPRSILLERLKNTSHVSLRQSLLPFQAPPPRTTWRARLTDFSAANAMDLPVDRSYLVARFAAPECFASEQALIHPTADVYALGVVLWQCLTRRIPWEGLDDAAVMWKVCEGERYPFDEVLTSEAPAAQSGIRSELAEIVKRCISEDPNERPTIEQIVVALERITM